MKRTSWILAASIIGIVLGASAQAQTVLSGSSWVPPNHAMTRDMMIGWGAQVEKATAGRVKLNMLPKAVTAAPGTFDAVRDGLVDVSFIVHGYTPGRFALTQVAEFPFLGDSATQVSIAYQRIYERYLAKAGEHKGVRVLAVFTHGPGEMYNIKRPIATLADLGGLKIRVGGGMVNEVAKAIGVTALLKPAPESYELLANGIADGTFFPAESIASFKLDKLIKYATLVPGGLYNTSFAMLMNEGRFNQLSKADQDAILSVSGEHLARLAGNAWDKADQVGVEAGKAAGINTITASPALVAEIKARTAPLEEAWIREASAKGVDGAKALAELREEIRKGAAAK